MVGSDFSIILIQAGPPSLPSTNLQRFTRSSFPTASSSFAISDDLPSTTIPSKAGSLSHAKSAKEHGFDHNPDQEP